MGGKNCQDQHFCELCIACGGHPIGCLKTIALFKQNVIHGCIVPVFIWSCEWLYLHTVNVTKPQKTEATTHTLLYMCVFYPLWVAWNDSTYICEMSTHTQQPTLCSWFTVLCEQNSPSQITDPSCPVLLLHLTVVSKSFPISWNLFPLGVLNLPGSLLNIFALPCRKPNSGKKEKATPTHFHEELGHLQGGRGNPLICQSSLASGKDDLTMQPRPAKKCHG